LKISRHQSEIWWSQIELTGDALAEPVNGYLRQLNRQLMPWNFQIQYSYLHSNVIMCIATFWQDNVSDNRQHSWFFNRGIHTVKIRALSNHKPGILKKTTLEWYIYIYIYIICYISYYRILFILKYFGYKCWRRSYCNYTDPAYYYHVRFVISMPRSNLMWWIKTIKDKQ
jgi:hypothetical protein